MAEASFPLAAADVVATADEIFRRQKRSEIVEVLESANAHFDGVGYDNWNGGTYSWALRLEVPIGIFASIEPQLASIEKDIKDKLSYLNRLYPSDHLSEVTVSPITAGALAVGQQMAPSELEVRRLWPDEKFRLFLSHVAKYKAAVSEVKDELALRGVAAFVAHQDIEPSRGWKLEIELALRSMHALAALVTPDFHASRWTDQEVGWAFGRGLLVMPVRLGADPYGFAGEVQGINGTLKDPARLAVSLVDALLVNPLTHGEMRRVLVSALGTATSQGMARALCLHLLKVSDFSVEEVAALWKACSENAQVSLAHGVPDAIYKKLGRPPETKRMAVIEDDVPF